ncbi:putative chloroplastic group IIB intron splicing facilitator CRS2, chloroplastic-like isoform X1 [Capsicum annuum]|nr:putative chloroplastic group IIB intron splicing facilitator CRS2, chloroplastic-like isoform X1 [Capsicum annuum]
MQALTVTVKGNVGFGFQNRQILQSVCDFRSRNLAGKSFRMTERSSCFGVNMDSASMGIELGRARRTVQSVFGSSAKPRSHRVRASGERMGRLKVDNSWVRSCYGTALLAWWYGEDIEDAAPLKVQGQSSGSVLPYVGVACLGAILFGYHLGVVNGALEYLAKDLGIAENTVIQGNIGAAMFLFQQLAGINAVVYYSTAVFRSAGITSDVAASALVGSANVFG